MQHEAQGTNRLIRCLRLMKGCPVRTPSSRLPGGTCTSAATEQSGSWGRLQEQRAGGGGEGALPRPSVPSTTATEGWAALRLARPHRPHAQQASPNRSSPAAAPPAAQHCGGAGEPTSCLELRMRCCLAHGFLQRLQQPSQMFAEHLGNCVTAQLRMRSCGGRLIPHSCLARSTQCWAVAFCMYLSSDLTSRSCMYSGAASTWHRLHDPARDSRRGYSGGGSNSGGGAIAGQGDGRGAAAGQRCEVGRRCRPAFRKAGRPACPACSAQIACALLSATAVAPVARRQPASCR